MRRALTGVFIAVGLLAASVSIAGAAPDENIDPPCADIIGGSGGYFDDGTMDFTVRTAAPSCPTVVYRLYILDEPSDTTPLVVLSQTGDGFALPTGEGIVRFSTPVADDDDTICVYATTSTLGSKQKDKDRDDKKPKKPKKPKKGATETLLDRAPDTGCEPITKGTSGGSSGFN